MVSALVVCCTYLTTLLANVSIEVNNVDPDRTGPIGAVWSGSTLSVEDTSKTFHQTLNADDFSL